MSKDLFEIKIKEQLSNMKAPVPEGAWEAIKSQIPTSGAPAFNGGSVGSFSFGIGIATGAILLASLGVYSELKDERTAEAEQRVIETPRVEESKFVEDEGEENSGLIEFLEAEQRSETESQITSTKETTVSESDGFAQSTDPSQPIEAVSSQSDVQNQSDISINPISRIDSNELQNANKVHQDEVRAPAQSKGAPPALEITENYRAEIMCSAEQGYAPLNVKLYNAGNVGESVWDIDGEVLKGNIVETTMKEPGTYEVYLTVYDDEGHVQAEDQIEIRVEEGSDIKLPNIFTPNGDGLNDTYRIGYAKNIKEFFIQITDETGRVVYTSTDTTEEWVYDQNLGANNRRYTVQYRAIGKDGKVHTDQFPLIIIVD